MLACLLIGLLQKQVLRFSNNISKLQTKAFTIARPKKQSEGNF